MYTFFIPSLLWTRVSSLTEDYFGGFLHTSLLHTTSNHKGPETTASLLFGVCWNGMQIDMPKTLFYNKKWQDLQFIMKRHSDLFSFHLFHPLQKSREGSRCSAPHHLVYLFFHLMGYEFTRILIYVIMSTYSCQGLSIYNLY